MGPLDAIKTCLAKSFHFQGRASRAEFWWFYLFGISLSATTSLLFDRLSSPEPKAWQSLILAVPLFLAVAIFSASIRRLHDVGRSGCYIFALAMILMLPNTISYIAPDFLTGDPTNISLVLAVVSAFALITLSLLLVIGRWLMFPSDANSNPYGPNPQEVPQ